MIEYSPWSRIELERAFQAYAGGELTVLDVQLGGACNLACIYCDSPDRSMACTIHIGAVERLIQEGTIRWLFVCGLGEPLAAANREMLFACLDLCKRYGIHCSMFTNGLALGDELLEYVKAGILNLLVKLDSLQPATISAAYGTRNPDMFLKNLEQLTQCVRERDGLTNIAASIVPTRLNHLEIPHLVDYCIDRGLYPLVADLEDSGLPRATYNSLKLSQAELLNLREAIGHVLHKEYATPICPSVVAGIHIAYDASVIVDRATGLSCHWFWLKSPDTVAVAKLGSTATYRDIVRAILDYRDTRLQGTEAMIPALAQFPLGGCGGDVETLLSRYVDLQRTLRRRREATRPWTSGGSGS